MISSTMLARAFLTGAVVLTVGCGGKILDEGASGGIGAGSSGAGGTSGAAGAPSGGGGSGGGSVPTSPPPPPPPPSGLIMCGAAACDAATQQCCVMIGGDGNGGSTSSSGDPGGDTTSTTCTPKGKCNGDIALSCSSSASCNGGQVCCANLNTDVPTATCAPSCMGGPGGGGGRGQTQLCASDKECPPGQTCQNTQAGFKFCRRPGGGPGPVPGGGP